MYVPSKQDNEQQPVLEIPTRDEDKVTSRINDISNVDRGSLHRGNLGGGKIGANRQQRQQQQQ